MIMRFDIIRACVFCIVSLVMMEAQAACLDPADPTLTTYYRPTIDQEFESADAILVGTVVSVYPIKDAKDPEGWVALIYTIDVSRQFVGNLPQRIVLRAENDSGGYRVSEGETHLLFLNKRGRYFVADPCGNSSEIADGDATLQRLASLLAQ